MNKKTECYNITTMSKVWLYFGYIIGFMVLAIVIIGLFKVIELLWGL